MKRKLAILLIVLGVLSIVAWSCNGKLPTLSFPYELNEWFGYISSVALISWGGWWLYTGEKDFKFNPVTYRRLKRFRSIGRGYWSLIILLVLLFIAALDQLVIGNKALVVKYDGNYYFPALSRTNYKNKDFGIKGENAEASVDYRKLKKSFAEDEENTVIMPFVPYNATEDKVTSIAKDVVEKDGKLYDPAKDKPYSGLAATLYDKDDPGFIHMRYKYRNGIRMGEAVGKNRKKKTVYTAQYKDGELIKESYTGEGTKEDFLAQKSTDIKKIYYKPIPISIEDKHFLGTDSKGNDILAFVIGGLQVNFKAAILFIPIVYAIGLTIGMLMGYFGGWFDIIVQRLIEIFANIPFLFVILILSGLIQDPDDRGLPMILTILIVFGWMGMTNLMRTAALKEKARDYVSAAKVMGAPTARVIFKHILPNSVAILVTLVPFSVSGLVLALTSLDYLGFGLPEKYATWGRLLQDGLENLSSPWIVTAAFVALVVLLVLITFIGEAIREAFDPKKFTVYK